MSRPIIRRSLLAVAGVTAGVTSLTVNPAVASAQAVQAQPDRAARDASTASHGTCFGATAFRVGNNTRTLPTTSQGSGNAHCTMSQGLGVSTSNGLSSVRALQTAIHTCYNLDHILGPVDGKYGPRTRDAVIWVQAIEGVAADGVYGPNTKNAMKWPLVAPDGDFRCQRLG